MAAARVAAGRSASAPPARLSTRLRRAGACLALRHPRSRLTWFYCRSGSTDFFHNLVLSISMWTVLDRPARGRPSHRGTSHCIGKVRTWHCSCRG